jgi:hypothetical protein
VGRLQSELLVSFVYNTNRISVPPSRGAAAQRGLDLPVLEVLRPHNDESQSIGFLWTSDQLVAETST